MYVSTLPRSEGCIRELPIDYKRFKILTNYFRWMKMKRVHNTLGNDFPSDNFIQIVTPSFS